MTFFVKLTMFYYAFFVTMNSSDTLSRYLSLPIEEAAMLRRRIEQELAKWKNEPRRKALLLFGARQIGKSYVVREFAKREYDSYVEINFYEQADARKALTSASNLQDFLSRLSFFSNGDLVQGRSLVMLDEIQECPDIVTMAKFLVEDGRYDYVFTGSMLGTELRHVRSFPVGYATELHMYPLDFEEFCWAIGISDAALSAVRSAYENREPIDDYLHEAMLRNFRTYVVCGGMPEVVQRFLDGKGDLAAIRPLQAELNTQYELDISKYAPTRAPFIKSIFSQISQQLDDQTRRFIVNSIDPGARYDRYEQDFLWLVDAGVALKCDSVSEPRSPLLRTRQASKFKLYQSDTGMLVSRYPLSTARSIYLDNGEANVGGIYENVVAQELAAKGYELYYHAKGSRSEVDFVIDGRQGSLPIEVKAGRAYRSHAALDALLATPDYHAEGGIMFSRANVEVDGNVTYLPLYMTSCLPTRGDDPNESFVMETIRV